MSHYLALLIVMISLVACGPDYSGYYDNPSPYGNYSEEAVNYFLKIGLCPEFGTCKRPLVKKWTSDVRIKIHGNYNDRDEEELDSIIHELSELTGLSIKKVTKDANINIYYTAQSKFKEYISQYNEDDPQDGLFAVFPDANHVYYKAVICIEDRLDQLRKLHLLREELTQSLGLPNDSELYSNSVFQQNPQYKPTEYSNLDREVIRLLYDRNIHPGMGAEEVKGALTNSAQQIASN